MSHNDIDALLASIERDTSLRYKGPTYVVGILHGDLNNEYGPIIYGPISDHEQIKATVEDVWLTMDAASKWIKDSEAEVFVVDPTTARGDD